MEDDDSCPLCCGQLDATDKATVLCSCHYLVCLWCYNQIKENAAADNVPAKCPNCRAEYGEVTMRPIDPEQCVCLGIAAGWRAGPGLGQVLAGQCKAGWAATQPCTSLYVGC